MQLADQVQAWIDAEWATDITVGEWWRRLADAGYAHPPWPAGLGGFGASPKEASVVTATLAANGVIAPPVGYLAATLAAPTILAHGSDGQKSRYVGAIARGEEAWCQLFSEPGSGSDLASVAARAEPDGEEWVVSGQKVWNSAADRADMAMLLARTDPDQPKHRGLTYFLIDMHQPGVEVRPLRQMNGTSAFCEVFLTEARVRPGCVLGPVNDGWRVAQTTLAAERSSVAGGVRPGLVVAASGSTGDGGSAVGEVMERARAMAKEKKAVTGAALPWRVMLDLARSSGVADDPLVRQELVRYHTQVRVNGWLMRRIGVARGQLTGADGSLAKLTTSRICQQSRDLGYRVAGARGLMAGRDSLLGGDFQLAALASPGTRIGGGTDEIQLNVIGERALRLPREPAVDRDVAYRMLKVGTQGSA